MSHPKLYNYKPQVKPCHECGSKEGYSLHWRCLVCLEKYSSAGDGYLQAANSYREEVIDYDRFMRQTPHRIRRGRRW